MPSPGEDVQAWSTVAATNATSDPLINWAEGQPRASVNNSARSQLAAHAKDRNLRNGSITTSGTANAQTFTSGVGYTTVPTGLIVRLKIGVTNTAAATLNMDSIGAVAIKDQAGSDIGANALTLGRYVEFLYNGTNWIVMQTAAASLFDALAYNGLQINGSMEVSQENGSTPIAIAVSNFVVDGWRVNSAGVQATVARQNPSSIAGFSNLLLVQVNPANAAPASGDYLVIQHRIEGYKTARLGWGAAGAAPITIAFWVNAFRAGNYSLAINNATATRSYAVSFTINASNTWEYKTITIPGDTAGTWVKDNGIGMMINIAMMSGTAFATAAGVWTAGNFLAATGTINGAATTSDNMNITGFIVLPGSDAPSAERLPFVMRPYDLELQICQRHWLKFTDIIVEATPLHQSIVFPVTMRAAPTVAGGGAGFTVQVANTVGGTWFQSARAFQTLTLDARL